MTISSISQWDSVLRPFLILVLMVIGFQHTTNAEENTTTAEEPKLRAAIVLGILRFTTWPDDVQMKSSFSLCTLGQPMSGNDLLKVSGQHFYQNLPINTHIVTANSENESNCNALVIGKAVNRKTLANFIKQNKSYGLLTICDGCQKNSKAMVGLNRYVNRIGFEIDLVESKQSGLSFSSLLLELAVEVKQK